MPQIQPRMVTVMEECNERLNVFRAVLKTNIVFRMTSGHQHCRQSRGTAGKRKREQNFYFATRETLAQSERLLLRSNSDNHHIDAATPRCCKLLILQANSQRSQWHSCFGTTLRTTLRIPMETIYVIAPARFRGEAPKSGTRSSLFVVRTMSCALTCKAVR